MLRVGPVHQIEAFADPKCIEPGQQALVLRAFIQAVHAQFANHASPQGGRIQAEQDQAEVAFVLLSHLIGDSLRNLLRAQDLESNIAGQQPLRIPNTAMATASHG
jgi:hypothetical protein